MSCPTTPHAGVGGAFRGDLTKNFSPGWGHSTWPLTGIMKPIVVHIPKGGFDFYRLPPSSEI